MAVRTHLVRPRILHGDGGGLGEPRSRDLGDAEESRGSSSGAGRRGGRRRRHAVVELQERLVGRPPVPASSPASPSLKGGGGGHQGFEEGLLRKLQLQQLRVSSSPSSS